MSKRAYIVKSNSSSNKYRLIVNVTDVYSVGSILNRSELTELFFEIKDLLELPSDVTTAIQE